jgi:high-affinity iron transporter
VSGILGSSLFGYLLYKITSNSGHTETTAKVWESATSLIALGLITTFIFWMMKHGRTMVGEIKNQVAANLSATGIFLVALVLVIREGAEVAIFSYAGAYHLPSVFSGIATSAVLAVLTYFSLVKVNLKAIFAITLGYLILQAGYLLGYGIHEGLEALEALGTIPESSWLLQKAYDLSGTILYHKEGALGLPLNVLVGWTSSPEWIRLVFHVVYVVTLFSVWRRILRKDK